MKILLVIIGTLLILFGGGCTVLFFLGAGGLTAFLTFGVLPAALGVWVIRAAFRG